MNSDQLALSLVIAEPGKPSREVKIDALPCRIGRSSSLPVVLDDAEVSSQHGEFVREGDGIGYRDLGSLNGSVLNGNPVGPDITTLLHDGDRLQIGKTQVVALLAMRTVPLPPSAGATSPSIRLSDVLAGVPTVSIVVRSPEQPEQALEFRTLPVTVGRTADNAIQIDDSEVSSQHGRFEIVGDQITFVDLNSLNGTRRNTVRLQPGLAVALDPGDTLQIGKSELQISFTPRRAGQQPDVAEAATDQGRAFAEQDRAPSEPVTGAAPAMGPEVQAPRPSLAKSGDEASKPSPAPPPPVEPAAEPAPPPAGNQPAAGPKKSKRPLAIAGGVIAFLLCTCVCVAGGVFAAVQSGRIPLDRFR